MSVAIGHTASVGAQHAHGRQPNFGSLVSAINRGDIDAAQSAFDALSELAPKNPGWSRKGGLEAIGEALQAKDLDAAKAALKALQQGLLAKADGETATASAPAAGPALGSTINILV
jgi:hypothetical protein